MTSLPADAPEIETEHDRLERNWSELLQELRVIQTGQIQQYMVTALLVAIFLGVVVILLAV